MPNILILILLSNQQVFLENFKELRIHYQRISQRYNIPITVVGYMGDSNENRFDEETGILHLSCHDKTIGRKLIMATEYIKANMNYDYVLKTNASTLVNLQLMSLLIKDQRIDWNRIYNKSALIEVQIGYDNTKWFICPCGTYAICSKDVFNTLFDDNAMEGLNEIRQYYIDSSINVWDDTWGWYDISEDSVTGWLAKKHNIQFYSLYDDLVVLDNYREPDLKKVVEASLDDIATTPSIICKTGNWMDIESRQHYEPAIIHLAGLLYESITISDKQYQEFYHINMVKNLENGLWEYTNQGIYTK